ncbi:MAG: hypothetical protein MJ252_02825, partial [archaeon]|nr:hypothetical protein [archaeon]
ENLNLFEQAKRIIMQYLDVTYMMTKFFELEQIIGEQHLLSPRLFSNINLNSDNSEDFYKKWLKENTKENIDDIIFSS